MSVLEMEINDNLYLRGEKISEKITVIHLFNGKQIRVEQDVTYNGSIWPWKVDDQYFGKEEYARRYLSTLIWEKMICSLGTTPADQDGTVLLLTVPMGIWMLFSKKIIIY